MKFSYVKWAVIGAALFAIFMIGRSCGIKSVIKQIINDTSIIIDSSRTVYVPVPYKVDTFIYKPGEPVFYPVHDTLTGEIVFVPADTTRILEKYFSSLFYSDTQHVSRGKIIINDTVSRNQITGRGLDIVLRDTTITKTIVLKQPKRFVAFFGISTLSNKTNLGGGIDFSLKMPDDKLFSIGTKYLKNDWYGEVGIKLPIRLYK